MTYKTEAIFFDLAVIIMSILMDENGHLRYRVHLERYDKDPSLSIDCHSNITRLYERTLIKLIIRIRLNYSNLQSVNVYKIIKPLCQSFYYSVVSNSSTYKLAAIM